ncbi:MAG: 4Fe-4S binding protein [Lentisphaeria bacterium]|nr:4Fe-4S binding protein [Lentisphaeria bacterium]
MSAKVETEKCVGCEACVGTCPVSAIAMKDGVAEINADECIDCGACVGGCPAEAIVQE